MLKTNKQISRWRYVKGAHAPTESLSIDKAEGCVKQNKKYGTGL